MKRTPATLIDPIINPSQDFLKDPYPTLARLQAESPVVWSEKGKYWLVSRYQEVNEVLRDLQFEKGFDRWKTTNPLIKLVPQLANQLKFRGKSMLNSNPPDHTRLRSLVNKAFTPAMVNEMRRHIEDIAEGLLAKHKSRGRMDLIADYAFVLPVTVIAEMLGIPPEDREHFKGWSHTLTEALEPSAAPRKLLAAANANHALLDYLKPLVENRRRSPRQDLISALVQAEEEGNKLSEDELLANLVLLLVAGHETTVNLIGNSALALLRHPEQLALLKSQPELLEGAVDEFLRYDSPVQLIRRSASQTMELAGETIAADDTVLLLVGAANHDPLQFDNPHQLDITRKNIKHLSFGAGIHHCLGSSLARAEGQIALAALMKHLPNLSLASNDLEYRVPFALRGVKTLPVAF